jgi:hypothetical protein
MYPLTADDAFFQSLRDLDFEIFKAAKAKPCDLCAGRMDTSHYPRKLRGAGEKESQRFSLCCRKEGCRHRVTPPSLRFLGRKIYSAWVVILALEYCRDLGLDRKIARQTIARWKIFWKQRLAETHPFMRWARGLLPPGTPSSDLPSACLKALDFPDRESWIPVLKFFNHAV